MDQFFVRILMMEEGALTALMVLMIFVGGFVGAALLKVEITFRRVVYLWWIGAISLALTISQAGWHLVPLAADLGALWLLVIAMMGGFVLFGVGVYYGSAARSNHIDGTRSRAWLGFIPAVNLYLMLRRSEADVSAPRASGAQRFVMDPFLVIMGIGLLTAGNGVGKVMANQGSYQPTDSAALMSLRASAQTLEESFEVEARAMSLNLPMPVDEITVLRTMRASGGTLFMNYDVSRELDGFQPLFEQMIAAEQCLPNRFGPDLARGGRLVYTYTAPSGRVIDEIEITQADCAT